MRPGHASAIPPSAETSRSSAFRVRYGACRLRPPGPTSEPATQAGLNRATQLRKDVRRGRVPDGDVRTARDSLPWQAALGSRGSACPETSLLGHCRKPRESGAGPAADMTTRVPEPLDHEGFAYCTLAKHARQAAFESRASGFRSNHLNTLRRINDCPVSQVDPTVLARRLQHVARPPTPFVVHARQRGRTGPMRTVANSETVPRFHRKIRHMRTC